MIAPQRTSFCSNRPFYLLTLLVISFCFQVSVPDQALAGFNNWSSAGPVGKAYSVAVSSDGTVAFAGGNGSIYQNNISLGLWKLSLAGPLVEKGIVFKPGDSLTAYAAAFDGIHRTTDGGTSWTLLGAPAQVRALAVDPASPADLYAATSSGLSRSTDGGTTWTSIVAGAPGSLPAIGVSAVAVTGGYIYVGTMGNGVWKSPTSAINWVDISFGSPVSTAVITAVTVDPAVPANIYATTGSSLYATADGGATAWTLPPTPFSTVSFTCLSFDAATSLLYVGVKGTPTGLYNVSPADWINSWFQASSSLTYSVAFGPSAMFANTFIGTDDGVLRNGDGFLGYNSGLTLPSIKSFAEKFGYYAGGGGGVWQSYDLLSWVFYPPVAAPPYIQISALAPDPSFLNPPVPIFAGVTGNGSFMTYETADITGVGWIGASNKSGGLSGTEVAAMVRNATDTYMAVVGDGVYRWNSGLTAWDPVAGNAGISNKNMTGLALSTAPALYAATKGGGIFKSINGGINWTTPTTQPSDLNILAIAVSPSNAAVLYAGSGSVTSGTLHGSTDSGVTWTGGPTFGSDVTAIGVHSTNPLIAVIGTAKNGAFITTDGGVTAQPFTTGLPTLGSGFPAINSVNFSAGQPSLVTLGLEGAGVYKRNVSPLFDAAPAALDFGTQLIGSNSILPITLKNSGSFPMNVSTIIRTITGGSHFSNGNGTCSTPPFVLDPGQSCAIDVIYSPPATGVSTPDNVNIYTDAPGSPHIIPLTGQATGTAATKTWVSPVSGNWSDQTKWSGGTVPVAGDFVAITVSGTYTVTVDAAATVAELIVGGATGTQTLSIPAATLTLDGASSFGNRSVLDLSGGTLSGPGQVDVYGALNWGGTIGSLAAGSVFNLHLGATGSIASGFAYLDRRTFNNYGTITYSTSNALQFYNAAIFNNYGTFSNQSFGSIRDADLLGAAFNNLAGGIFEKSTNTSTTNLDIPFNNSGSVIVKIGSLALNKDSSHSGSCAIDVGTTLAMAGLSSHNINSGATFTGAGTLSFAGTSTIGLNIDLTNTVGAISVNDATINGPGKLVNASGKSITLVKATINAGVDNSGAITATGNADSAINGALTTQSGSLLKVDSTIGSRVLTVANGFTNFGTIELNSSAGQWDATLNVTSGTLTNVAGAGINALTGSGGAYKRNLNAQLDNQGAITAGFPLFINKASAVHKNSGTIGATDSITITQSGTTPSFTNTGTITIAAGKSLTVNGGEFNHNIGSTFTGTGSLAFTNSTVNLNDTFGVTVSALNLAGTTVNGSYDLVNPPGKTLTMDGSTINVPLYNDGTTIAIGNADSNLAAGLFTSATSILRVDATTADRTLVMASGFTNYGAIELNSSTGQWNSSLTVATGPLTNAATGIIKAIQGSGGSYYRYLNAEIRNQGIINASWPLYINKASAVHTNSGTVNVTESVTLTQSGTTPSFTNTGMITIAAAKNFIVSGGTFNHNSGASFSGSGIPSFTGTATVNLNIDLNSGADIGINDAIINGPGKLVNAVGMNLKLDKATINAGVDNSGAIAVTGNAASAINGALTTQAGSLLKIDATSANLTLTVASGFTNNGTIELNSSTGQWNSYLAVASGPLTNASTGIINAIQGSGGSYYRYLNTEINNQGIINASWPLYISKASASHSNSGTINATESVTLTQLGTTPSFTNSGVIAIAVGKSFTVSGGTFNHNSGSGVSGLGTLAFTGTSIVNLNIDLPTSAAVDINGATVNGPGKMVNPAGKNITMAGATINAGVDNSGTVIVTGSADSAISGALTTQAGSLLKVDATVGSRILTVAGGFINNGTIELNSSVGQWDATLAVSSGTLTNGAAATINAVAGSGGTYKRYLNAQLDNQGTITADYTTVINKPSAVHLNSGTINVNDIVTITQTGTTPSFTNSGVINIAAAKSFTVSGGTFNHNSPGTLQGTGTLTLAGATFSSGGAIHPNIGGAAGVFNIAGAFPAIATNSLNVDIGGITAGSQYDQVTVTGAATLNGALNVNFINGFTPTVGDSFTVMTYGSKAGAFASTNLPPLGAGKAWALAYNPAAIVLSVAPGMAVSPAGLPSGSYGTPYSQTIVASGGTAPYTYTFIAGTLPAGLALFTSSGLISGIPTSIGSFDFTVRVTDALGNIADQAYSAFAIGKANQTITFGPLTAKTYGDVPFNLGATADSGLSVSYSSSDPTVASISGSTVTILKSGSTTITASQSGDANFNAATGVDQVLTVNKATATVILGSLTPTYDGSAKAATATTTPPGLTVGFTYDGSATVPVNAGSYAVVTSVNDLNYSGSATGTLAIGKANQTITFSSLTAKTYGDVPFNLGATADSGLSVSYSSSDPTVASISGSTVTIVKSGSTTITANQSGNTNFNAATGVDQVLTVNKATATVTLASLSQTYDGTAKPATATTTPVGKTVTFTYDGSAAVPISAGTYAVVAMINDTNYSGTVSGNLVIGKAAPVITWNAPAAITYGTPLSASQLNATASVAGTFSYNPVSGTAPNAGTQTLSVTFIPTDTANYTNQTASVSFTVNALPANQVATGFDGKTTVPMSVPVSGGSLSLGAGTLLTDAAGNPISGTLTVTTSVMNSIAALPAATATAQTADGKILSVLGNSIDITISAGVSTVKTINPPMIVNLPVASTFALPGATVSCYSFDGTTWQLEGTAVVKPDNSVDIMVGHLSVWAVAAFVSPVDNAAPVITAFTVPATSSTLLVPISSLVATDNVAVTGYILSESASAPSATDLAWTAGTPADFIFPTWGNHTLYAYAKDAADNVSTVASAIVLIGPVDGVVIPSLPTAPPKLEPQLPDALKSLNFAMKVETPTATDILHGDVAPLVNGIPQPDGVINLGDTIVVLRRVVGL